ncbi:MAG: Hydrogenase 1 maturation protease [candidate division WS2 bacterium]|nr:Hydrogenase 1 maturation protease [Candidatus Psychracetigena formicireducens]
MFKRIAVIGLGNSLRRDDGIGIIILECLLNHYKQQGIDYLNFGIASFDLMHRLQDYDLALLIDGISAGLPAGELKIFDLKGISSSKEDSQETIISSHELNLLDIFRLSRSLELKTKIYIAGIQVQDVSFGESLSTPLKEKLETITEQTNKFIQERLL